MKQKKPAFLLEFNGVVVIQSLPAVDLQTGSQLYEDIISKRCEQKGHASYFYDPGTKQELCQVLERICYLVLHDDLKPMLHFEVHGYTGGLGLRNGESITWSELRSYARLINIATKNQLVITLASCYGAHICEMINELSKPAPFWGFIGPKSIAYPDDLLDDYSEYFDSLLTENSLDHALDRIAANDRRRQYIYLHAKGIFENCLTEDFIRTSLNKKATFQRLKGKSKEQYPNLNRAQRRTLLKYNIATHDRQKFIADLKKTFLIQS